MVLRYVVVALILLVVPLAIQSERDLRKAIRIHIISGTLVSVFGFMLVGLFILGKPVSLPICRSFGGYAGMWGVRLAGTAYEPAGFANYLLSVIPITFAVWINERKPGKELLLFAAFVIQSSAMLFTLSSGGWLALVLILPLLLLRLWKKMNRTKKMGLLVLALLPLVLLSQLASSGVVPTHRAAFVLIGKFTIDTAGRSDRVETAKILLRMISDYPLLGIGPGNFAYKVGSYTHKGAGLTDATKLAVYPASWRANNDYLTIPAETGIPAFLVFMLFIGALLKYHFGVLKSVRGTADEAIIVGMVFAVIALLLQAFAAFSILNPFIWVLSALIYGYHRSVTVARDEARL
jgi:O-antigen ligase